MRGVVVKTTRALVVLCAALVLPVFGLLAAVPAGATKLENVRVGRHADKTRVVIEADGAIVHQLDQQSRQVVVKLDASSGAKAISSKGPHLRAVKVTPTGASSQVVLDLRGPADVRTMTLTKPDRLVIDLYAPGRAPAQKTAAAPPPVKKAAPPPPPKRADPKPTPPAPKPAAAPAPVAAAPEPAEKKSGAVTWDELAAADEASAKGGEPAAAGAAAAAKPGATPTPKTAAAPVPAATTPAPAEATSGIPRTTILLGALILIAVGAFVVMRSRSGRGEVESASPLSSPSLDDMLPKGGRDNAAAVAATAAADPAETDAAEDAEATQPVPIPPMGEVGGSEPASPQASIFDEPVPDPNPLVDPGADPMAETETDKPEPPEVAPAATASAAVALGAAGASTGAAAMTGSETPGELERRLAHLETRLEEVVDAKERLERQVVAQTEELRVQRAAIARTQRVLRGLQRPEDEATEPVPKPT